MVVIFANLFTAPSGIVINIFTVMVLGICSLPLAHARLARMHKLGFTVKFIKFANDNAFFLPSTTADSAFC